MAGEACRRAYGHCVPGHWFDREELRDNTDGAISFLDELYFTMITVTTAGYGTSGAEAVDEVVKRGADPETIVVIDDRTVALYATEAWGTTVMQGDATRNAALEAVQLACARALFFAAGWDDTSDPDRPEPRKSRRRPVGRVGPTARISRRINGSRRGRRTGRPARTSTDRDRGRNRAVGQSDRSFGFCEPETQRLETGDLIVERVRRGQAELTTRATTYQYGLLRQDLDPMCALRNQRMSIRLRRSRSASVPPSGPACL